MTSRYSECVSLVGGSVAAKRQDCEDKSRDADRLCLSVEDDGRAFDPLARAVPDTGLAVEEREIGGLGIHFVRSLVQDIAYERRGPLNRLTAILSMMK